MFFVIDFLDAWDYIQQTRDQVQDLSTRLQKSKFNVEKIENELTNWTKEPLFTRKETKQGAFLNIEDRDHLVKKRYEELKSAGEHIVNLVAENKTLLKATQGSNEWKEYLHYIDRKVAAVLSSVIECSLKYILENMTDAPGTLPLFRSLLDLQGNEPIFKPGIDRDVSGSLLHVIDSLLTDVFKQASLITRVVDLVDGKPAEADGGYLSEMEDTPALANINRAIVHRIDVVLGNIESFRESLDGYSPLWTEDRQESLAKFLLGTEVPAQSQGTSVTSEGTVTVERKLPTLKDFKEQIDYYEKLYIEAEKIEGTQTFNHWLRLDLKPFRQALLNTIKRWSLTYKQHLIDHVSNTLEELNGFIKTADGGLSNQPQEGDLDALVSTMGVLMNVRDRQQSADDLFEPLRQTVDLLKTYDQDVSEDVAKLLQELPEKWNNTRKVSIQMKQYVAPLQATEVANIRRRVTEFEMHQIEFRETFRTIPPFSFSCPNAYDELDKYNLEIIGLEQKVVELSKSASLFEVQLPDYRQVKVCRRELKLVKQLWDYINIVKTSIEDWKTTPWLKVNVETMDMDLKKFSKDIRAFDKETRAWDAYSGLENIVKNMLSSIRAVGELQNPAIRQRHWQELMQATGVKFTMDESTTLADLLKLNLHEFEEEVKNIVDKSVKEMGMEKVLGELDVTWSQMEFEHIKHPRTQLTLLQVSETLVEALEENQVQLQNMLTSKYIAHFLEQVSSWQKKLAQADQVITIWMEVQRTWSNLESIFIGSEDIRKQLPEDSARFDGIDSDFRGLVAEVETTTNVIDATSKPRLYERLEQIQKQLSLCEKALADYMETKRLAFPRFYFVSTADLLDILSNGNNPELVARHLTKLFDSMARLKFNKDAEDKVTKIANTMEAKDGEPVPLANNCDCSGEVEVWLNRLLTEQRATVRHYLTEAVASYEEKPRDQWIFDNPAQVALTGSQIQWTTEVNLAFARLEEGYENALKDFNKKQVSQLNQLITHLLGQLSKGDRQKICTICTIDVHARDVVIKMIANKVESGQAFMWLSQLRHRWDDAQKHCFANICDAQFRYDYEYLGNTPRLVITPLTDRCYITLTQSLHLIMGGAPAGPAGTGKTETTKDLGKALGIMVYVFNCSEQMDYKSLGNIYKGLAQSGSWGCFDEFNRISVEVLSVVAVQVKTIQDAIRHKKQRFNFLGEDISLTPTVGIFITMNPGYAGRAELPENLKALFRPCAMVVPDFDLISEIMLVAEGFTEAKLLARKFITLYTLCRELLSKQDHYDWGLRAIKSVLVVAGALRRADPDRPEDQVLMRALRDFNIPKIVTDDVPVFMGLIGDLFPALDVPRKRDVQLEKDIKEAAVAMKLQPEDNFILKVVQLQELLDVRHSVFILGNAGTGKSQVWKTLHKTWQNRKTKPIAVDLDPKAVTNDELFGIINPATREWKDGLFSVIMRDLANLTGDGHKWIVLDGDIDPMWIESLNTVMDDNKILTLASNERIALTPSMRLVFEINHLKTATPATVSRAGILYLNPTDLGWGPYVTSWLDGREAQAERANLIIFFEKYVPPCLEMLRTRFKKITPTIPEISHVMMLCYLLECMDIPPDSTKDMYEQYFVFCCIWAFGGCLGADQISDYRVEFSKWWNTEFKQVKLPSQGTCFDYYIEPESRKFESWTRRVPSFELDPDRPLQATLVHTVETTRIRYFLDLLLTRNRPVMLVGNAGTGKTVLMEEKLRQLPGDQWLVVNVPFNFMTTSEMLQRVLEKPLEKKAGRNYGPPGSKRLIYFIDDAK